MAGFGSMTRVLAALAAAAFFPHSMVLAQPVVVGVDPTARTLTAPVTTSVSVTFDRPILTSSIVPLQSFWVFGRWSGTAAGSFSFSNGDQTVTLTPDRSFSAGEMVTVFLSHDIEASDGTFLRSAGYSFQFWTASQPATLDFIEIAVLSTNIAGESSRPYGGMASDLNGDGWNDLAMVNEDTDDIRVFMNLADASGNFSAIVQPTSGVGNTPSPSEPSDFNRDGDVDVCTADTQGSTVSILLGNGDGTFAPQQLVTVATLPRGIAVLDVDGDGDVDIVNGNASGSGSLSTLINDGTGTFGPPTFFQAGSGEWSLGAADMNEDGILDLVVGSFNEMIVMTGNGDGTFTFASSQPYPGRAWMLVIGDVNGDGHEDVSSVNNSNGIIQFGDGTGQLGAPQLYATDPFSLATDLGDLDGDGDLDWVTASFQGDWFMFLNDGNGVFTFDREFLAPAAASCSIVVDIDNDGDMDLVLIDEIADTVGIMSNDGPPANPIPTTGTWGLVAFVLSMLIAGSIIPRRLPTNG